MNALVGRIRLDFREDEPLFLQIARQIEALVAEGTLRPGDQLPTVRELAIDLRINFSTVARAYRILDEQRLISTQRGRGTYIWEEGAPGGVQEEAEAGLSTDKLSGLTRRFIQEAVESGASVERIEQVFQRQINDWKRDHWNTPIAQR